MVHHCWHHWQVAERMVGLDTWLRRALDAARQDMEAGAVAAVSHCCCSTPRTCLLLCFANSRGGGTPLVCLTTREFLPQYALLHIFLTSAVYYQDGNIGGSRPPACHVPSTVCRGTSTIHDC